MAEAEFELDGKTYVWTGTRWYAKRDYLTPSADTVGRLNKLIAGELEADDAKISDPDEMVQRAQEAREHGQL
ncbi:MAG: hypothetical protein ABR941_04405, partial [Thermoleophilia bacterium]